VESQRTSGRDLPCGAPVGGACLLQQAGFASAPARRAATGARFRASEDQRRKTAAVNDNGASDKLAVRLKARGVGQLGHPAYRNFSLPKPFRERLRSIALETFDAACMLVYRVLFALRLEPRNRVQGHRLVAKPLNNRAFRGHGAHSQRSQTAAQHPAN